MLSPMLPRHLESPPHWSMKTVALVQNAITHLLEEVVYSARRFVIGIPVPVLLGQEHLL
jgi:hypothetical protein